MTIDQKRSAYGWAGVGCVLLMMLLLMIASAFFQFTHNSYLGGAFAFAALMALFGMGWCFEKATSSPFQKHPPMR